MIYACPKPVRSGNSRKTGTTPAQKRAKRAKSAWKKTITRLDDLVRSIIKLRDNACYCGKVRGSTRLDVGHLFKRGIYSLRWDLKNCHATCQSCNLWHNYHAERYTIWFLKTYGLTDYELLNGKVHIHFERRWVEEIERGLRETLEALQG